MIERVAVLPDIHTPKHEESAVSAALKCVKDYKPHVLIQLGDLLDLDSIAKYPARRKNHLISLQDELEAGKRMFDRIEEVLPNGCKKIFIEGNHEDRLERFDINDLSGKEKKLLGRSSLGNVREEMDLDKRRWKFVRYGDIYSHGKCLFSHGWYINKYHAAKTLHRWYESIVYGHTHTYQVHTVLGRDRNPVAAMSIGTLSRFDLSYVNGIPPDWIHMFALFDFYGNKGHFTPHTIPIINGQFSFGGKVYGN